MRWTAGGISSSTNPSDLDLTVSSSFSPSSAAAGSETSRLEAGRRVAPLVDDLGEPPAIATADRGSALCHLGGTRGVLPGS